MSNRRMIYELLDGAPKCGWICKLSSDLRLN
uniref:Hantavirus glycoprotein G2 n=1 Tax=Myoviridae sp. ctBtT5 TaxID=2825048 RepID=A0A8S5PZK0_9CAUD|nr:MAG TPA: Hantavirus glycoprotein G2 [Myoviridae sp. ctBtT5]